MLWEPGGVNVCLYMYICMYVPTSLSVDNSDRKYSYVCVPELSAIRPVICDLSNTASGRRMQTTASIGSVQHTNYMYVSIWYILRHPWASQIAESLRLCGIQLIQVTNTLGTLRSDAGVPGHRASPYRDQRSYISYSFYVTSVSRHIPHRIARNLGSGSQHYTGLPRNPVNPRPITIYVTRLRR